MNKIVERTVIVGFMASMSIVLAYWFVIRPWHLHWGATPSEVSMPLPGDQFIAANADISTRAITIHAPTAVVWQWVAQIGQDRAGFYSYHWLENLFAADMRNADEIRPEWQNAPIGRKVLLAYYGSTIDASALPIVLIEPGRTLVLRDGWGLYLFPIDDQTSRLIVRYPLDPKVFGVEPLSYGIFETAHFVMESGMMLGIKERAEAMQ